MSAFVLQSTRKVRVWGCRIATGVERGFTIYAHHDKGKVARIVEEENVNGLGVHGVRCELARLLLPANYLKAGW